MRTRRSITSALMVAAVLVGCGSDKNSTSTPPPTDAVATTNAPADTTTAPTTVPPISAPPTNPAQPTTVAPLSTTPSAAPTTTRQVITLPAGVTEADRAAAEAAAIGWWEEFDRQLLALPDFDPSNLLKQSTPGAPIGPAFVAMFEGFRKDGVRVKSQNFNEIKAVAIRFISESQAIVEVCSADDAEMENASSDASGLGSVYNDTLVERVGEAWLVSDYGRSDRGFRKGERCAG